MAAMDPAPRVDVMYGNRWHDIASDTDLGNSRSAQDVSRVRFDPGAVITRGRRPAQTSAQASTCDLTISDRDGKYARRNPRSALAGRIVKNTALRVANRTLVESFTAATSNGWGTANTGQTWTTVGGDANDYSSGSAVGSIVLDTAGALREVYTANVDRQDLAITTTVAPGSVPSTGSIQMFLELRRVDANNNLRASITFQSDGNVFIDLYKEIDGGLSLIDFVDAGFNFDANSVIGVEFLACGNYLEVRAWDTDDPDTDATLLSATDDEHVTSGAIGVLGGITAGNTVPRTIEFGPIEVLDVRFTGEVPEWRGRWSKGGRDVRLEVQASGLRRRLGSTNAAASPSNTKSAIRRYLERYEPALGSDGQVVAAWMMEEGPQAQYGAPLRGDFRLLPISLRSHPSGSLIRTDPQWGKGDLGPYLPPGLALAGNADLAGVYGAVRMGSQLAGVYVIEFAYLATSDSADLTIDINPSYLGGESSTWPYVKFRPSAGTVAVSYDGAAESVDSYEELFDGRPHWISWVTEIVGSDTEWTVTVDGNTANTGTETTHLAPRVAWVALLSAVSTGSPAAVGALIVWENEAPAESISAGMGWPGEPAGERIQRLCEEEGIPLVSYGDMSQTPGMGPQRLVPPVTLMEDCETTDQGFLYEPRMMLGFGYRTRASLHLPTADLTLDYTADLVSIEPADDETSTLNDVVAADILSGPEARYTVQDGPLGIDTIGTYPARVDASIAGGEGQLEKLAGWVAHKGTYDEERWQRVEVDLRRPALSATQAATDAVLDFDIGQVLAVTDMPDWTAAEDLLQVCLGATERFNSRIWELSYNTEPARPYNVATLEDANYGRLGSAASTVAAEFDAGTDTSLSVAIATGHPLWVTGAVDFDILVAGIRLHVTNIAGASSPQTFTVDATSVNGVSNTIRVGERIRLYHQAYFGMGY